LAVAILIRYASDTISCGVTEFAGFCSAIGVGGTFARWGNALLGACSGIACGVGSLACTICVGLALIQLLAGLQTEATTALFARTALCVVRTFDHAGFAEGMASVVCAFFDTCGLIANTAAEGIIAFVAGIAIFEACVFAVLETHTCCCIADFVRFTLRVGSTTARTTVATVSVGIFCVGSTRTTGEGGCEHHRKSSSTQKSHPSLKHSILLRGVGVAKATFGKALSLACPYMSLLARFVKVSQGSFHLFSARPYNTRIVKFFFHTAHNSTSCQAVKTTRPRHPCHTFGSQTHGIPHKKDGALGFDNSDLSCLVFGRQSDSQIDSFSFKDGSKRDR
jgi:hypothetical protein